MKRFWPRVLSAFSTLAVGLVAASVARVLPGPAINFTLPCGAAEVKAPPPTPQSAEAKRMFSEIVRPRQVSLSPYAIKKFVDEHREDDLGTRNGYHVQGASMKDHWDQLGIETDLQDECHGCEAKIFNLELDEEPGREVMLRLHEEINTTYLFFKPLDLKKDEWKFVGYFSVEGQGYGPPEQRVFKSGAKRWLVLSCMWGHGSGYGSDGEMLYEITRNGVREVLSYLSRKFLASWEVAPTQEITSKLLKVEIKGGVTKAVVQYSVRYTSPQDDGRYLWGKIQEATFTDSGVGSLDERASELTEEEFADIYEPDGFYNQAEIILMYYYPELMRIAAGRDEKRKGWLRKFLDNCGESAEKQSLLTALGGEQP